MGELSPITEAPDAHSLSRIHGDAKLLTLSELWETDCRRRRGIDSILGEHDMVGGADFSCSWSI